MTCRNGGDCLDPDLCHCAWDDSDCIAVAGSGNSDNAVTFAPIIDPDEDNIVSCSAAGLMGEIPADIIEPAACRMRWTTAAITVENNRETAIQWNSFRFNARSLFTFKDSDTVSTTQGYNVVIPVTGLYIFHVQIRWAADVAAGTRKITLYRNGGATIGQDERRTDQTDAFAQSLMVTADLLADDTVSVWAYQNSGSSMTIEQAPPLTPEFAIVYRGPTLSPPSQN